VTAAKWRSNQPSSVTPRQDAARVAPGPQDEGQRQQPDADPAAVDADAQILVVRRRGAEQVREQAVLGDQHLAGSGPQPTQGEASRAASNSGQISARPLSPPASLSSALNSRSEVSCETAGTSAHTAIAAAARIFARRRIG